MRLNCLVTFNVSYTLPFCTHLNLLLPLGRTVKVNTTGVIVTAAHYESRHKIIMVLFVIGSAMVIEEYTCTSSTRGPASRKAMINSH